MMDRTVQDWMAAPSLGDGQARAEKDIAAEMAGSCESGSLNFPTLIQDLEPYVGVDQEDLVVVGRGMALLPLILDRMVVEPRTRQDIQLLVTYLCLRLKNESAISNFRYGLDQIADCLTILVQWKRFFPGDAVTVADAIFSLSQGKVNTFIDLAPSTRLKFYSIIWVLVSKYERQLTRDMGGAKFVNGLVELSELEKSAVSLKELFALYAKIGKDWELTPEAYTQLWDCFVRYFPITLGANQKDDQPKPEDLKELLRQCFTANSFYAKEAFDTLLGNIDADQGANKKKEILIMLGACVDSYSIPTLLEYSSKIWDTIKFEIWNGENDEFIIDSLRILNGLFKNLSKSDWRWEETSQFSSFVEIVVKEIFERLSDMQRYVSGSARMLLAIGASSSLALRLVLKQVLPGLLSMSQDEHAKVPMKALIGVFNAILQARVDLADEANSYLTSYSVSPELYFHPPEDRAKAEKQLTADLTRFRDPLIVLYFSALSVIKADPDTDPALSKVVIQGLVLLSRIPSLLLASKGLILSNLNDICQGSSPELQIASLAAIREIAIFDPQGFKDVTLPSFIKLLPEKMYTKKESDNVMGLLENLLLIGCTSSANHDEFHHAMIQKFDQVRSLKGQLAYLNILIAAARRALSLFNLGLPAGPCETRILNPLDGKRGPYSHIVFPYLDRIVGVSETNGSAYIGLQNNFDSLQPFDDFTIDLLGQIITTAMLSEFYEVDAQDEETPSIEAGSEGITWDDAKGSKKTYRRVDNILVSHDKAQPEGTPSALLTLFRNKDDLARVQTSLPTQFDFSRWPADRSLCTYLTVSLLAGVDPKSKTQPPLGINVADMAEAMIKGSITIEAGGSHSKLSKVSMLSLLQLLINKFGASSLQPSNGTSSILQIMLDLVDNPPHNEAEIDNIYRTLSYFSAASLAAYTPTSVAPLITRMLFGIHIPTYGKRIAQSFRILLAPSTILSKENFCTIRPLRKGRLFELAAKPLLETWRTMQSLEERHNCLVALAGIIRYIDPSILHSNIAILFPALLSGTNISEDEWAKSTYLTTILSLIPLAPEVIEEHLDSVINRMTDRTRNTFYAPSDSSISCRVLALDVLGMLCKYVKTEELIKRRFGVVAELDLALDDCSRAVRARAQGVKISWFNLKGESE